MEDKLVTLAIHTFEKAQILKTILETEGIEVYIHNVNQIQPVVSAGVRVRIKESDLPHALRIIEDNKWFEEPKEEEAKVNAVKKVLIPIDFSDYSAKACELGINYAHAVGAEVMIMHAYFSPYFPSAIPMGDTLAYQVNEEESVQHILQRVRIDMENICTHINRKMSSGELPKVKYDYVLREGLPEEEIIAYSKEYHPTLIVMGTRGKSQKDMDLIGSVTGEVIEVNRVPVLAIPENVPFTDLRDAKNIAFATSFNQRDLVAFDEFMEIIKGFDFNIFFQGVAGADVFDGTYRTDVASGNYPSWMLGRWTGEGTSNKYPRLAVGNATNWMVSDLYVCDGSYLRLKNITLGYTLPKTLTRKLTIERLRVYVQAENLVTWTKYWGFDPEISSGATSLGVDRGIYPQARTYTVGVNVSF